MRRLQHIKATVCAALALAASSCFTGVESTPRIGTAEVNRYKAGSPSAESLLLRPVQPLPPRLWASQPLVLRCDDSRISRVLTPGAPVPDSLVPREVAFAGASPAPTLLGEKAVDLTFRDIHDGTLLSVRSNVPAESLDSLERLVIPFTIDLSLVSRTDSILRGRRLFVATDQWYDGNGRAVRGLRHVEVRIDSVAAGSSVYPCAVYFTPLGDAECRLAALGSADRRLMLMSVGGVGASSRSFETLFSFESPRTRYPGIEDAAWQLIIHGKVAAGMTPTECRLALGSPSNVLRVPTRGGMREHWTYDDGVFLLFDDGYLSDFRL